MNETKHNQRKRRVTAHVRGSAQRPRAAVARSLVATSIQLIDDTTGVTLVSARTAGKQRKTVAGAHALGMEAAKLALGSGITKIVFDRGGYVYHGRVKAVAEGLREGGLAF